MRSTREVTVTSRQLQGEFQPKYMEVNAIKIKASSINKGFVL